MIGLLTGETQLMFAALGPVMPHVKAGKMRALAVTTPKRTQLTPELPTVAEDASGLRVGSRHRVIAPRRTPAAIVNLSEPEVVQALKATDPQKVFNAGVHVVANLPEEFSAFIKSDMTKMGEVIKSAGFDKLSAPTDSRADLRVRRTSFELLDFRQPRNLGEFLEGRRRARAFLRSAAFLQMPQHRLHRGNRCEDDPVRVNSELEAEASELVAGRSGVLPLAAML
jgi:hypothetical protein